MRAGDRARAVDLIERVRAGQAPVASDAEIARHSRRAGAADLAGLLDSAVAGGHWPRIKRVLYDWVPVFDLALAHRPRQ